MKLEPLKVSCPYCLVGHCEVMAVMKGDVVQVHDIGVPRKCVSCHNYIALKPRVTIEGVKLANAIKEGRHVA